MTSDQTVGTAPALERFAPFRENLLKHAGEQLGRLDPAFVHRIRTASPEEMGAFFATEADGLPLAPAARQRLTRYVDLCSQLLEVELSIRELRVATVLIGIPGEARAEYQQLDIDDAARFFHNLQAWSIVRSSLFERTLRLVKMSLRRLPLSSSKPVRDLEAEFSDVLDASRVKMKLLRDAAAHGGNLLESFKRASTWHISMALGYWPGERQVYSAMFENRSRYERGTLIQSAQDFDVVAAAVEYLNSIVDWGAGGAASWTTD